MPVDPEEIQRIRAGIEAWGMLLLFVYFLILLPVMY